MKTSHSRVALPITNSTTGATYINTTTYQFCIHGTTIHDLEDKVFIIPSDYQNIFHQTQKKARTSAQLLKVVKISSTGLPGNKRTIYRECYADKHLKKGYIALTYNSLRLINGTSISKPVPCSLTKSNRYLFYWYHPVHATRISMRLGIVGLVLAISGLVVSLLQFL